MARDLSGLFTKQTGERMSWRWRRYQDCLTRDHWLRWVRSISTWSGIVYATFAFQVHYLSRVQHPNIIRLFATCIKGPNVCLIMEYGEGGSLYNLLHCSRIKYTASNAMSWCRQCADVSFLCRLTLYAIEILWFLGSRLLARDVTKATDPSRSETPESSAGQRRVGTEDLRLRNRHRQVNADDEQQRICW